MGDATPQYLSLAEVTRRAIQFLCRELGPSDTARFLGQYAIGSGDYTTERDALSAGRSLAELTADIRAAVKTHE